MKSKNQARSGCNRIMFGIPGALALVVGALILAVLVPQPTDAQSEGARVIPEAQFTADGTEACLKCHAGERMTLMGETAHGDPDDPHSPYAKKGCESCHGPGSLHVSRARGGRGFPAMVRFGAGEELAQRQTEACTDCHGKDKGDPEGMEWAGSAHDTDDMTCISCHELHIIGNPLTDPEQQRKSCAQCHEERIADHPRFEDKGIIFDRLTCYDCHDVHQLIHEP